MKPIAIRDVIKQAMIAAAYVVLVLVFQFMSFEAIQFRIAEVLLILVFFDKKSIIGLSIGTFLANWLLSPFGIADAVFGTMATVLALVLMRELKRHVWLALLMPAIANGIIIGWMLNLFLELPFWETALWIFLGEAAVLYVLGLPLYLVLRKHQAFRDLFDHPPG